MKFKHFANLLLPVFFCSFFTTIQAQNHPFSWKVTSDPWFRTETYAYRLPSGEFTAKGKATTTRGPVCSNECKESTAPDACTRSLIEEKLGSVELPGSSFPPGYSGVEFVTFEVQTNGNIGSYQVVKQSVLCKPCIQQAVNLVASLGEWHPAVEDGLYVNSTVVVPVHFKTKASD